MLHLRRVESKRIQRRSWLRARRLAAGQPSCPKRALPCLLPAPGSGLGGSRGFPRWLPSGQPPRLLCSPGCPTSGARFASIVPACTCLAWASSSLILPDRYVLADRRLAAVAVGGSRRLDHGPHTEAHRSRARGPSPACERRAAPSSVRRRSAVLGHHHLAHQALTAPSRHLGTVGEAPARCPSAAPFDAVRGAPRRSDAVGVPGSVIARRPAGSTAGGCSHPQAPSTPRTPPDRPAARADSSPKRPGLEVAVSSGTWPEAGWSLPRFALRMERERSRSGSAAPSTETS